MMDGSTESPTIPALKLKFNANASSKWKLLGENVVPEAEQASNITHRAAANEHMLQEDAAPPVTAKTVKILKLVLKPDDQRKLDAECITSPELSLSNAVTDVPQAGFCGTFKYRPFRLFPLITTIGSHFRVHIPAHWTDLHRNRAVSLRYLWTRNSSRTVFTDDSDLFCVLLQRVPYNTIKHRSISVEVEIVPEPSATAYDPPQSPTPHDPHPTAPEPRVWTSKHDGAWFHITAFRLLPRTTPSTSPDTRYLSPSLKNKLSSHGK